MTRRAHRGAMVAAIARLDKRGAARAGRVRGRRALVAAVVRLDKLPVWVSFPVGLGVGVAFGIAIMASHVGPRAALLAAFALGIALWLGLSAPRPVQPEGSAPARGRGERRGASETTAGDVAAGSAGQAPPGSSAPGCQPAGPDRDILI